MKQHDDVTSIKLQDLAEIQPGYQNKGQMINDESGDLNCIQVQDLDHDSRVVKTEGLWKMKAPKDLSRYMVTADDLLYLSRGSNYGAYRIQNGMGKAISLAHFFILKPLANCPVRIDYLWVVLNERTVASQIQGCMKGSIMTFISKAELGQINIPIPSMDIQNLVVELALLRSEEKKIRSQIEKSKDTLYGGIINMNIYNKMDRRS